jgi:tetratricopeptide (TPR) repeat protein
VQQQETLPVKPEPLQETGGGLELQSLQFSNIFPVFHKYYDDHPVGTAVLYNPRSDPVTDITLNLEIKPYMTAPKRCKVQERIEPGQSSPVELYALFSEGEILAVTEGTKASAEITWEYTVNGQKRQGKTVETVRILNRNAMTWEDDRRAAAFVTALDPAVLTFSKNVSGMLRTEWRGAVDPNILTAIGLYEALCQYGMSYVVDPKSAYTDFSQKRTEVDFLQFPQQTLEYKAGDCDDLSILYCAIFESVGIETAFITIPGHIFMAFSLGMGPEEARKSFQRPDDLVFEANKAWIPFEVTALDGKFLEAWQLGAKEWREGQAGGKAALYPLHDAWQIYEPVGLVGGTFKVTVPPKDDVAAAYQREMQRFVEREIYPEIARLQGEIQKSQNSLNAMNKLGVLYAKYNLLDEAERQFLDVLAKDEYVPALVNLGNISYMRKDLKKAAGYYERAYRKAPEDAKVVVCLARAYHELENYGLVGDLYQKLKSLDPGLAQQFAYLDLRGEESTRAADLSGAREVMVWGEE